MTHNYEIGTSYGGMENLEDLTVAVPAPKSDFDYFSKYLDLISGRVRGAGWMPGEWRWTYLTRAQRDQLKTFCSGASSDVYIRTRKNDTIDAYEYYTAIMIWPKNEDKSYSRRLDFVIEFRNLEVYTP